MRLNRSDAEQNRRAASICKAYAKRIVSLQAASNQDFIGHCENFRFRSRPRSGIFSPGFGTHRSAMLAPRSLGEGGSMLTNRAEGEAQTVGHGSFDYAD